MKAIELKFLLKLLGKSSYRTVISELKPSEKTSASERNKICIDLTNRGIVAHSRRVEKFKLEPSARALLAIDAAESPLTAEQLAVLRACQKQAATPGEIKKVEAGDRQRVIQDLEAKGFIKAEKVQIQEVWLTELGQEYLSQELSLSGTSTISLNLFNNYVQFMRKIAQTKQVSFERTIASTSHEVSVDDISRNKPDINELLQIIQDLDRQFNTGNYLPLFHLRQKLISLSREELDQMLYELQRQDKIELSTLQEGHRYTNEQIEAGIRQPVGGPLFFIEVL
jgi:hypothetical protein